MRINLPNAISLVRVLIAPIYFVLILSSDQLFQQLGCILFLIGALSDYIDGWYARKYNEVTALGKFVDPLADKILTSAAFLSFVYLSIIPMWMVILIIIRDFGTTILRIYGEAIKKHVVTSKLAQVKTALQMVFIAYILILVFIKDSNSSVTTILNINSVIYSDYTYYSMLIITLLTLWTILEYVYQNKSLFEIIFSKTQSKNYAD